MNYPGEAHFLLRCMSPFLARKRPLVPPREGPLTEVLRTEICSRRVRLCMTC
jgi:hypothetical protein